MTFHPTVLFALVLASATAGQAPQRPGAPDVAAVHAVLFHSPTCPHCQALIANGLPPLRARYGARLQIAMIDASTSWGYGLYTATLDHFGLPQSERGVPLLIVGARVLVGGEEIPAQLPGIVDRGLAAGGIDWPDLPLLRRELVRQGVIATAPPESERRTSVRGAPGSRARSAAPSVPAAPNNNAAMNTSPAASTKAASETTAAPDTSVALAALASAAPLPIRALSVGERFLQDRIGNSVAVVVLLAMLTAVAISALAMRGRRIGLPRWPEGYVPVLGCIGLGIAAYLSYIELTGARAVCGPMGDCNTVQQSAYATLLGVPVGLLGAAGYLAIIGAWTLGATGSDRMRKRSWRGIWAMALLATLFSAYLTFLEPFVIGATCAWCVSSALIVTMILLVATRVVTEGRR